MGRETVKSCGQITVLDKKSMRRQAVDLLAEMAVDVPKLRAPLLSMSGGQRQCIAIGKLLLDNVKLMIMEEPMATLGVAEGQRVLTLIERLRQKGVAVLIISHNLEHVFAIADAIVVLKNGRLVGMVSPQEVTRDDVVKMITTGEAATPSRNIRVN